jgi:Trk K+ transport system NAD-binding subunit
MSKAMRWALSRWTRLNTLDYASLLQLTGDYSVRECRVESEDWLAGKSLQQLRLHQEGVTVLGIHRASGDYLGVPRGETKIRADDRLILYGPEGTMDELEVRRRGVSGDEAHDRAVSEIRRRREAEQYRDEQSGYN